MRISKISVAVIDIDNDNFPTRQVVEKSDEPHAAPEPYLGKRGGRNTPNQIPRSYDRGHVPARAIGSGKSMRSQ